MRHAGHVLIATDGQLLDVDAALCDILRCDPDWARGRYVMEVTAPDDRRECAAAIATLLETHQPFEIVKRLIRRDGSLVRVRNSVSIMMNQSHPPIFVGTIEQIAEGASNGNPAILLDVAHQLVTERRDREKVCDSSLFSEPGWDTVLAAYVAEAEGRVVDVPMLSARMDHAPSTVDRWVKALVQHSVLEHEYRNQRADAPKGFRLTADAHRKLEAYLGNIRPRSREMAVNG